jgi:DNA-binding FadR family transcriptional regulator
VSRTVVREAVRALAAKRLVDVSGGRRTVVRVPWPESAAESMKLLLSMQAGETGVDKVSEARHIIESEIAALAAARRTDQDLQDLVAILEETRQHLDDPEVYIKSDVAFHAALARATKNELLVIILDSLVEVMIEVRLLTLRVPGITSLALSHHERILEAVVSGDASGAKAAMDAHMDQAAETLRQAVISDPA